METMQKTFVNRQGAVALPMGSARLLYCRIQGYKIAAEHYVLSELTAEAVEKEQNRNIAWVD